MRSRILFVDDESMVLQGLRRMLRGQGAEWEMSFVESGAKALELLAREPFDVVVTDMRMPEMNGAELLERVRSAYPHVIRLILSGQSSEETMLASVGPAHQFLAKPCDADRLKETIKRACALRGLLGDARLQRLLSQLGTLPSPPEVYIELLRELRSPLASVHRAAEIIATDPGMTAKLLQLVNSAFFGIQQHVTDAHRAASILGLNTITSLVLSVKVFSQFDARVIRSLGLGGLMHHSMQVGAGARAIARDAGVCRTEEDESFTAGLLHDVGQVILGTSLSVDYQRAVQIASAERITIRDAEEQVFGASHAEVGAYLLGLWGLPDSIVAAVAYHNRPSEAPGTVFTPLTAVHVANSFALEASPTADHSGYPPMDTQYLMQIGRADSVERWREVCAEAMRQPEMDIAGA